MTQKRELAKAIKELEGEIHELEVKRSRSQAALIEALISKREPNDTEVQFFRAFTTEINVKRDKLYELMDEYKKYI